MTPATAKQRAATLHDVARQAGVSLATASRVLNGSTRKVAESYRERVEAAAADLGYSANLSAQATARGTSATIALLVANIADSYFSEIAAGVAHAAEENNLVATIGITERSPEREARLIRSLRGQRPRGIVLAASRHTSQHSEALTQALAVLESDGARIVTLGYGAEGVSSRVVGIANHGGTKELGARLGSLGYRTALVLAAAEGLLTSDDRVAGFSEGFTSAGGSAPTILRDSLTRDAGYSLMEAALQVGVEPGTVVFGASDVVAFGAMSAVRDAGREVGDDIAIAGFGDIETGRDIVPSLTTVSAPLEQLGRAAVEAIIGDEWTQRGPLSVEVIVRDSTPAR